MKYFLILTVLGSVGAAASAGTISVVGEASAKPNQAKIHLYLKQDGGDNVADRLKQTWDTAREWLISAGVPAESIKLDDPIVHSSPLGERKRTIQRVTITRTLKGEGGPDAELLSMAKLIDQAGARGLSPASQLAMMGLDVQDLYDLQEQPAAGDVPFIAFVPDAADTLRDLAAADAMARLRARMKWLGDSTGIADLKLSQLSQVPEMSSMGQPAIAVRGTAADAVVCRVNVQAEAKSASAKPTDTLTVTTQGTVDLPAERAVIRYVLTAADKSLQRAMEEVSGQGRALAETVGKIDGAKLHFGGVRLYSGAGPNNGMEEGAAEGAGPFPAGAFRWVTVSLERGEKESLADFRKRIEQIAVMVRGGAGVPAGGPEAPDAAAGAGNGLAWGRAAAMQELMNLNDGRTTVVWGPKDVTVFRNQAIKAAMANAKGTAERLARAAGAKLGPAVDVALHDDGEWMPVPFQGEFMPRMMGADAPRPGAAPDMQGLLQLDQKLAMTVSLTVAYAAELP